MILNNYRLEQKTYTRLHRCIGLEIYVCTVQYSTVQYSKVQYCLVQYSTVQYSIVQYSKVQYSKVQYRTVPAGSLSLMKVERFLASGRSEQYSEIIF